LEDEPHPSSRTLLHLWLSESSDDQKALALLVESGKGFVTLCVDGLVEPELLAGPEHLQGIHQIRDFLARSDGG
jgi:hypothetical protein